MRPRTPHLETRRLLLRPLELTDAEQAQPLFAQWEIVRLLTDRVPWPFPPDGVLSFYRDHALPAMERGEEWNWTIRLKSSPGQLIGSIGLATGEDNRGFWTGLPWQRHGYITEACVPVNDFWFDTLGEPVLRVPKAVGNIASRRVSEKQGMRLVGVEERGFVSGRLPAERWELTAEQWRKRPHQAGISG